MAAVEVSDVGNQSIYINFNEFFDEFKGFKRIFLIF